ncbi:uncharacterized protein V1513DRAFT_423614 [Lipomyces chichibuensis]|uniref:uncharacterized protein n=1 Tax=Lipomyces chichibuensis TaxID=1546026 RepID=UPI003343B246
MADHSNLLDVVRRPLSPDIQLEVPASREEYERVQEVLESEGSKYPRLWYDSTRNIAIVIAAPSAVHSDLAGELLNSIVKEVAMHQGIDAEIRRRLSLATEREITRGLTTRGWDGALLYRDGNRSTLMIAVEVGVSQAYESLRAAISWSVCALHCRLGIALSVHEGGRGETPDTLYYQSIQEGNATFHEAEEDFRRQLMQRPYGPLNRDGVIWYGRVRQVILETYRTQDEDTRPPETLLHPSQSFKIVQDGELVGDEVPPNLREVVLEDCIPSHILSREKIIATPVNFFRREWFEATFQDAMDLANRRDKRLHHFALSSFYLYLYNVPTTE